MRRYETIVIIDSDISKEESDLLFGKLKDLIPRQGGFLIVLDEWGIKKLAYEIKKKLKGFYIRMDYCGTGALVDEMERLFRIDDRILKYMTILLDKNVDIEKIKEEVAAKEEAAAAEAAKTQSDQSGSAIDDGSDGSKSENGLEAGQNLSDDHESVAVESETTQHKISEKE